MTRVSARTASASEACEGAASPLVGAFAGGRAARQAAAGGRAYLFHLRRAAGWRLSELSLLPGERARLGAAGVTAETGQRYQAWRRSAMIAALPLLALTALMSLLDVPSYERAGLTPIGVLVLYAPPFALLLMPVLSGVALLGWADARRSHRLLAASWLLATILPIVLALAPPRWLLDLSGVDEALRRPELFAVGVVTALGYSISLLPTIVSIPAGVMRGCLRVKGLLPFSALPGWFLVTVAPFYSLLSIVACIVVVQLAGGMLLVAGVALFALAPWLTVLNARTYVQPLTSEADLTRLAGIQQAGFLITVVATVLLVAWALSTTLPLGEDGAELRLVGFGGALIQPWDLLRLIIEFAGRSMLTAVVFAHLFLRITALQWRDSRSLAGTMALRGYDELIAGLDSVLEAPGAATR